MPQCRADLVASLVAFLPFSKGGSRRYGMVQSLPYVSWMSVWIRFCRLLEHVSTKRLLTIRSHLGRVRLAITTKSISWMYVHARFKKIDDRPNHTGEVSETYMAIALSSFPST